MRFDTILRAGRIVDGSAQASYVADVGLREDRIAAIGDLAAATADKVLDVAGLAVAPGFLDVHNHSDGHLLRERNFECKTSQGFTTELLMSDGISYAPVDSHTWREWMYYLRALNGLQMHEYRDWRSLGEYMGLLDGTTAQNSVALAPYGNIRTLACGFRPRPVDDFQRRQIQYHVREAMDQGAVGLSTGIDYVGQTFSTTAEIVDACRVMQPDDGLYVTHVRYKLGLLPALREAFEIARRAGVRLHISHLKAQSPDETEQVFALLDEEGADVDYSFDVYPYQPGSTMLSYLLPYEVWESGPLAAAAHLVSPELADRFAAGLSAYRLELDEIRIAWVAGKDQTDCQGMSLADFITHRGTPPEEALTRLLLDERFAVLLVFVEGDDALVEPFLQHPKYMMGSDGIFFPDGAIHPRVYGSAPRLLGPCVRDLQLFDVEEAVRKMTSWPAERFGLKDRGWIREGAFADLVVFDPRTVADRATYDDPHQRAVGIPHVFVNGVQIIEDSNPTSFPDPAPGRYLPRG